MELSNINAAYGLCESLYGVTPEEGNFEDLALDAWGRIGTKHTRLYRYVGTVKDNVLELPCNVDIIESVHIPVPDARITGNTNDFNWENVWVEKYIDFQPKNHDPYFTHGKLVYYDEGNNELYFAHNYPKVMIVYHGIMLDDEGLPLVNDKELRAIASFIGYTSVFKDGIKRHNTDMVKIAQTIKEDWLRACNSARVAEHLSQNDMDAILDAKTSWNRKQYRLSLKPVI